MASVSASMEVKTPRCSRFLVRRENHPSTRFSQLELVGVKCRCQRARSGMGQPVGHRWRLVGGEVVEHHVDLEVLGHVQVDQLEEGQHVLGRVACLRVS